jgi:hypothetical protein
LIRTGTLDRALANRPLATHKTSGLETRRSELTQDCMQIRELGNSAILEFQWIEIRCTVKVINVFDSFEPQRYFNCYWQ